MTSIQAPVTAASEFDRLNAKRAGFILRAKKYASYTLPRLVPEDNYDQSTTELTRDYQSVGAQATNHLSNRLMLTLFAPSRPIFRLEVSRNERARLLSSGLSEDILDKTLAAGEREASRGLDRRPLRPKLHEAILNLIVVGNALAYMPPGTEPMRTFGIQDYVVRRTGDGRLKDVIVREALAFDELDPRVQGYYKVMNPGVQPASAVKLYRWITRTENDRLSLSTWVDSTRLGPEWDGEWPEDKCPWRVWTWNLADRSDYGTGLVEDFAGAFAALSTLSQAAVEGAVLSSEFRWLVNPAGATKPDDLTESENGAALPGSKDDIALVTNSKSGDLQVTQSMVQDYIRQIGYGFLMNSAVQRDAERVTATEIRQQAIELETAFGGVYTRLAGDMQTYIAHWLLAEVDLKLDGTKIELYIVTGLDALSRNGDLDAMRGALNDYMGIATLPPEHAQPLKLNQIATTIFLGWGLDPDKYVKSAEQIAKENAQAQQQQQDTAVVQAAAQQAARQGPPTQ